MKTQPITEQQLSDIQKLTGFPRPKIMAELGSRTCSIERFRHFCLNQGVLPSPDQQAVLAIQEKNGQLYDFPTPEMIENHKNTPVFVAGWSGTIYNAKKQVIGHAK